MSHRRSTLFPLLAGALVVVSLMGAAPAGASTLWVNWTGASAGAPGSAAGTVGVVQVGYSGELDSAVVNGSSNLWAPNSSFIGGTSTVSPSTVGDHLALNGNYTGVNTITFSSPVVNPLIAIWSLGSPGTPASFIFLNAVPTLEAGGPNSQYGGSSITVNGNTVSGAEGNGVVQFTGTFSSISWTNTFENFYAFTVGVNGTPEAVPEPGAMALLGIGSIAGLMRRRRAR